MLSLHIFRLFDEPKKENKKTNKQGSVRFRRVTPLSFKRNSPVIDAR